MKNYKEIERIWGEIRALEARASTATGSSEDYINDSLNSLYEDLKKLEETAS